MIAICDCGGKFTGSVASYGLNIIFLFPHDGPKFNDVIVPIHTANIIQECLMNTRLQSGTFTISAFGQSDLHLSHLY